MAPTYNSRFPGSHSDGLRGSALILMSDVTKTDQTKAALRATAMARRDALPAAERAAAAAAIAERAFPVPVAAGTIDRKSVVWERV